MEFCNCQSKKYLRVNSINISFIFSNIEINENWHKNRFARVIKNQNYE